MNSFNTSRRTFLGKSVAAVAGIATLTSQNTFAAIVGPSIPFEGYNPYAEFKNDLRVNSMFGNPVEVSGTLYSSDATQTIANAKIEVWHLSPGSDKYRHRGYFFTDEDGRYSFKTDFPNNENGKKARIYFKISNGNSSSFTELILDNHSAYIHKDHWEKNSQLKDKLFPKYKKSIFGTTIQFNFSL